MLYTADGIINIKNEKWKDEHSPIDEASTSCTSRTHSKAYLRHLIHAGEYLGAQIATLHNLCFYLWLVGEARQRILAGDFLPWKNQMVASMGQRL
jgi:queuine tRNA-ribosyltransferase